MPYPISLYSTGVVTFDDVNKCESLWKVLLNYVIHDGRFANSWTVDYYDIFLKDVTSKILNMKAIFASILKSRTGLNFLEAIFSPLLKKCSLLRKSLSFSFLNPQITYMIFIYSQSLKENIVLEYPSLECVSICCHKTKLKSNHNNQLEN